MAIGLSMIIAGVLPMPLVYLLRRFQILKVDLDIHQGSIRRNETTASTKQMMDDDDVSNFNDISFCKKKKWSENVLCFEYDNNVKLKYRLCYLLIVYNYTETHYD